MLRGLGIETGVDLEEVAATSAWMARHLGRPSPSAVVRALAGDAAGDARGRGRYGTIRRMNRAVYLHIGAPKTGTTYVQDRLALNARSLARHDVHVPTRPLVSPGLFHFRAALDLLGQDWGGQPGHAEGGWDALVKRVRRSSGTVDRQPRGAGAGLPRAGRAGDARPRRQRGPRRLLRARPGPAGAGGVAGEHQAGSPVVLPGVPEAGRGGGPVVPPGLRPAGRARHRGARRCRPSGCTWSPCRSGARPRAPRTCCGCGCAAAFGIDPAWAPRDSDRANRSLGIAETQVVRRLNRRIDRATRREAAYDDLIREKLAQDQLVQRRSRAGPAAPGPLRLGRGARPAVDRLARRAAGST